MTVFQISITVFQPLTVTGRSSRNPRTKLGRPASSRWRWSGKPRRRARNTVWRRWSQNLTFWRRNGRAVQRFSRSFKVGPSSSPSSQSQSVIVRNSVQLTVFTFLRRRLNRVRLSKFLSSLFMMNGTMFRCGGRLIARVGLILNIMNRFRFVATKNVRPSNSNSLNKFLLTLTVSGLVLSKFFQRLIQIRRKWSHCRLIMMSIIITRPELFRSLFKFGTRSSRNLIKFVSNRFRLTSGPWTRLLRLISSG